MDSTEHLILVDINDDAQGVATKSQAHREGLLHRAFSIIIYNNTGKLLLQQRARHKYHSADLWSNACCGHPKVGEDIGKAAARRLKEELGFTCDLSKVTEVSYFLPLENNMYEHEYTHVFCGTYDGEIYPNAQEVSATSWIAPDELLKEVDIHPEKYTVWFKLYITDFYNEVFRVKA